MNWHNSNSGYVPLEDNAVNLHQANAGATTVEGSIGGALALNSASRDVDAILRNTTIGSSATEIENIAEKSGADVAVALGVGLTKTAATTGTGSAAASLSYNMSDSDVHALMIDNTVKGNNNTTIGNKAEDADVQIAGGVSAAVASGSSDISIGVGGSAAANRVRNDVQSGLIRGSYNGLKSLDIDAVKSVNQVDVAVAADYTSSKTGLSLGFSGLNHPRQTHQRPPVAGSPVLFPDVPSCFRIHDMEKKPGFFIKQMLQLRQRKF